MNTYLQTATHAAKKAGKLFKQHFGHPKKVRIKNHDPRNFVTEIDRQIEQLIRNQIHAAFPTHKIVGEEFTSDVVGKDDFAWYIDPIDGTTNYIHGLPFCCISIALWDSKGPLVGVVYNPMLGQLCWASRGKGTYLNGKKISVTDRRRLIDSFGGYGWGRDTEGAANHFPLLIQNLNKIRTLGSTAMEIALVAKGTYDFHVQSKINIWDFAAAVLLLQEAGGKVTGWDGKPVTANTSSLVASNGKIHKQLLQAVKKLSR